MDAAPRTSRPEEPRTFRTLPAQVIGWALVVTAVIVAVLLTRFEQERQLDAMTPVVVMAVVVAVVWVGLLRPCVQLGRDGVVLRNLFTDTEVPFSRLQAVERDWALELVDTAGHKHSAWAVPVRRDFRPRGNLDRYAEATTKGKAREGVHAESVVGHVEHAWHRWQMEGGRAEPDASATTSLSWPAVVPLAGSLIVAVLVFTRL